MAEFQWDSEIPGFGRRSRDGRVSWVYQYSIAKKTHRIRLGGAELSKAQARDLAKVKAGEVSRFRQIGGTHPAMVRDAERAMCKVAPSTVLTLGAVIQMYLEARKGGLRPRSYEQARWHLEVHWKPYHEIPVEQVTRANVAATVLAVGKNTPVSANRARAHLSALYRWAIGAGLCDANPVRDSNHMSEPEARDRSLSDGEIVKVWNATEETEIGKIVQLLLLTGCRRNEIGGLRWSEIDLEARTITLPRERTKNGQKHVVPLSDAAMAVICSIDRIEGRDHLFGKGPSGYNGWSKGKKAFDKLARLGEPWCFHDLRRTCRSGLGKLGVAPHVAEAVINHMPEKLIRTYDTNKYENEKRAALDAWAGQIRLIVAQATGGNVVTLRKA